MAQPYLQTEYADLLRRSGKWLADDRALTEDSRELEVDVLIGMDYLWQVCHSTIKTSNCGLKAMNSIFGWLITGVAKSSQAGKYSAATTMLINCTEINQPKKMVTVDEEFDPQPDERWDDSNQVISKLLADFYSVEHAGTADNGGEENGKWLADYLCKIQRAADGRCIAPLPWIPGLQPHLHLTLATLRIKYLVKKLSDTNMLIVYHSEMLKLFNSGFIEEVKSDTATGNASYMPHLPVIRSDKATSKVRPVFDGSAKTKWSASVNDCLETGPNLNPDLFGVLLRFRRFRVAWIADVEQAFLNVQLTENDSNALRFLWIRSPENHEVVHYKWKRLPFGLNSSPFVLRAVFKKHLEELRPEFPDAVGLILDQLYVDDLLGGAHDTEAALAIANAAKDMFAQIKMKLHKWLSNCPDVLKCFQEPQHEPATNILKQVVSTDAGAKALGVRWDTKSDVLCFDPSYLIEAAKQKPTGHTKRDMLRLSSRIFDP